MCGIAGIIHFSPQPVSGEILAAMTDSMIHRGPDANGQFIEGNVGLGHRRLSIIDLATGSQPMANRDKTIVIAFNGEIYNYIELRSELRSLGRVFESDSDTEVILQAYEEWGPDCQSRLNGMWAFAIWDSRTKTMLLSRDRCGEKPLYYSSYNGSFYFGSEAKSLLTAGVSAERNIELLEIYLTFGYIPAPHSFYKNINKLRAGHYMIIRNGQISEKSYWSLPQRPEAEMRNDRGAIEDEFSYLLQDSVKIRMRCDVPYGAFLSGGLDSASVVALMSELSDYPIETFTIGFDEKEYDERGLARLISNEFRTNHHEFSIARNEFEVSLNATLRHFDEPFGDSSAIPTGYVAQKAGQYVKMVLTGDGGDELLSGYESYGGEKIAMLYQKIPKLMQRGIPDLLVKLGQMIGGEKRYKLNRAAGVFTASGLNFSDRLIHKSASAPPAMVQAILADSRNQYTAREYVDDVFRDCMFDDPFYKLMYFHFNVSLPEKMLTKVDRMSMAHSIETRAPFLDFRLVELMAGVSKKVKMQGLQRKVVLRNTVGSKLPPALLNAPKKGFNIPLREWFKDEVFADELAGHKGSSLSLDYSVIADVFEKNRSGKKDFGNFIWMLFVLDRWMAKD